MKRKTLAFLLIVVVVVSGLIIVSCGGSTSNQTSSSAGGNSNEISYTTGDGTVVKFKNTGTPPPILEDLSKKYTATIAVAGKGNMVFDLFAKDVPKAVSNFVYLSLKGFYNGTTFHRVIKDFMAQGGDPEGTGMGGPGYSFGLEITQHKHLAGTLSMANTGQPNSNGSQFFICFQAQPFLDGKYSVFGQLTQGMDVLQSISLRDPQTATTPGDKITRIDISVK